jgi:hypothetical protein
MIIVLAVPRSIAMDWVKNESLGIFFRIKVRGRD